MEFKAIVHTGSQCGFTVIDPSGITSPDVVPVTRGNDKNDVIGKASQFRFLHDVVHASIEVDDGIGLSPAISGTIKESVTVGGIRHVSKFELRSIGLVPPNQTDTKPLTT